MDLEQIGKLLDRKLWSPNLVVVHAEKIVLAAAAYVAGDVVSENITTALGAQPWIFRNCAKVNGGGGYIVHALIQAQTTAIGAWFTLHLHNGMPTCELGDAVQSTCPILADREIYQGKISFSTCTGIGTNEMDSSEATPSDSSKLPKAFVCGPSSRDLQGVMAISNAVDLADVTILHATLWIEQY